ncbi:hypothetical protein DQ04_03631100 [Trypanosoma grayi]|uniref:hypothetical protein n=1 Tax=Trypanosoma grayi TaxID=71804 RepID=UPI0004F3FC33|nr:hypothetical protein DQ04_03631100 [Trypanosoma grayi]KEG10513.1 hypothetical protein DQ04_03631100 [Trypanosoma grayi]
MRSLLYLGAGALLSLSWFTFADGLLMAKQIGVPYNFLMWLPSIMILCGMFVLRFVDAKVIAEADALMEDGNAPREKTFFFVGALLIVGGFAVALWKAIDPYAETSSSWPGVSLVIQSVLLALCSGLLFLVEVQRNED